MTLDEAIEIIKSECYVFNPLNFDRSTRINTALDMAIKALEQEPCEDCISRKAVKELFQEGSVMGMYHFLGIDELPSVTQTRPKEHWIDNNNGTISCSYCYTWFYKDDRYSYMRYCPYCGAEMESEE